MQLYHFCPVHLLRKIKRHGLSLGTFPIMTPRGTQLIQNMQWLTVDPDPTKQSWATRQRVKYDRTACRLTINISESCMVNLIRADEFVERLPEAMRGIVLDWDGHENWYIYQGQIPPFWITKIENMEA